MGISETDIFLSFFMVWVVNLFKYLWNPASFFTLRNCKQTTVVTAEKGKVVIISSNTAAVATCPRNSGFDCDSLSTIPEETWSGVHCSSLLQSDVTTAWQQYSLSEGRCTQILHLLIFLYVPMNIQMIGGWDDWGENGLFPISWCAVWIRINISLWILRVAQIRRELPAVLCPSCTHFLFLCFRVLVGREKDFFFIQQERKFRTISPRSPNQGAQINCSASAKL